MGVTADKLAAGRAARALHSEAPALQRLVGLARPLPEPPAQQRGCPPRRTSPPPRSVAIRAIWDVGDRLLGPGKRSAWSAWPSGGRAALPRALARRPAVAERRVQATRALLPAELRSTDRSSVAVETGAPELRRCVLGAPLPPQSGSGSEPSGITNADTVPRAHGPPPGASPAARVCPGLPPRVPAERRLTPPPPAPSARPCHRVSAAGESPAGTVPDRKGDVLPDLPRERRRGTPDGRAGSAFELAATFLSAGRPGTNAGGRG